MTYEYIIQDSSIAFVVLRSSISEDNPQGITILKKEAFTDLYNDRYVFERLGGENNDIAYLVRKDN